MLDIYLNFTQFNGQVIETPYYNITIRNFIVCTCQLKCHGKQIDPNINAKYLSFTHEYLYREKLPSNAN